MKKDKPARKGLTATESIEAQALRQVQEVQRALAPLREAERALAPIREVERLLGGDAVLAEVRRVVEQQREMARTLGVSHEDFMRLVQQVEQWEPFARWARDEHDERIAGELVAALHAEDIQAADAWFVEYGDEMRPALVAAIIDSALNRGVKQANTERTEAANRTREQARNQKWRKFLQADEELKAQGMTKVKDRNEALAKRFSMEPESVPVTRTRAKQAQKRGDL